MDFVGHIGGDDFMLVLSGHDWEQRIADLHSTFALRSSAFYQPEHLAAGCFISTSRDGRKQRYALLSLRSEEHTSELQSLMRISYAGFCLKKKKKKIISTNNRE